MHMFVERRHPMSDTTLSRLRDPKNRFSTIQALIFVISGLTFGIFIGNLMPPLILKDQVRSWGETTVTEPKLLTVGAILPDQNGKHFAARTTLDRSLNYGNALEVYVRSQDDGRPMWGYIHIKDYASYLRWKTIESRFKVVSSGNFADITYRDQFGYIKDPTQGFFKSKVGFQSERALNPGEYWIVVWLTPGYEG